MKRAFLIGQLLVLLAGFAAINLVVGLRAYRRSVPRLLIHDIDASPPVTDLFMGNSLICAAIDTPVYERVAPGSPRTLSIGLGASSPVEHALLERLALRTNPRHLYYGFYDMQLTEPPVADFGELAGNRALDHYLYREAAIRFLCPDDPLGAWRIRLVSWLPVVMERLTLWSKVENARRRLGEIGMARQATNQFGRVADFALLEARDTHEFAVDCGVTAAHWAGFSAPVADMVATARRGGATFTFLEMPMPQSHRQRFYATPEWKAYEGAIRKQAKQDGASFVSAVDWMEEEAFADPLHLTPSGAIIFSRLMAAKR